MIGDRWNVTEEETRRTYACDALVPDPALEAWRGVTVAASPAHVWAWVKQIRLAPYSYDWIDNLGRTSPRELRDLEDPSVGDPFIACAGRPLGEVLAVEPGRALTGEIMGAVMSYAVEPAGPGESRLLLKIVMRRYRWAAPAVALGDLVMARKQLLTWKELAERTAG